jgi:hypothetical protein
LLRFTVPAPPAQRGLTIDVRCVRQPCARLAAKLRPIEAEVRGQLYNSTCFSTYRPNKPALGVAILEFLNDVGASKTANWPKHSRCPGLNRTLTDFCANSTWPICNEYGPMQMGAPAHRFTRRGFLKATTDEYHRHGSSGSACHLSKL